MISGTVSPCGTRISAGAGSTTRTCTLETRPRFAIGSSARIISVPNWKPVSANATTHATAIPAAITM